LLTVLAFRSSAVFAGPERYLVELVSPLADLDFRLEVLALYRRHPADPPLHPLVARFREGGWPAEQWPDPWPLSVHTVFHLAQRLRSEPYALLHCQDYKTDLIGGLAAHQARVPAVATVHGHLQTTWRLRTYRLIDLVALRLFGRVIAVSEALRQELLAAGLAPDRVVTVHNGLDVARFETGEAGKSVIRDQEIRKPTPRFPDSPIPWFPDPTIAVFGRLDPQKGQRAFLLAARQVHATRPDARFVLVGDGPDRARLEQLSEQLGIANHVHFAGHQADVAGWLQYSDVVVLPSWREGLPYVLLEALALARPVVATAVGGIPEVIGDGAHGRLVAPGNLGELAQAMLWMLDHPAEAAAMGEQGRRRVLAEFTAGCMARQTANVYRTALTQARG
jgi:glycosyltransferase involved in cell wall biosynthesis